MASFKVDPKGGPVEVDFSSNLPVFVMTAFAVWADEVLLASGKEAPATPAGVADFIIPASVQTPSLMVSVFDCSGSAGLVGEELRLTVRLSQGDHEESFALQPVAMVAATSSAVTIARGSKQFQIELVS